MIEYFDEKLGKIKVLNVTEARANFAAVLGDKNSHYIITKNNKPLRVIINYSAYEILKNTVENDPTLLPLNENSDSNDDFDSAEASPAELVKAKSRVSGILESHMALAQSAPAAKKSRPARVEPQIPKFTLDEKIRSEKIEEIQKNFTVESSKNTNTENTRNEEGDAIREAIESQAVDHQPSRIPSSDELEQDYFQVSDEVEDTAFLVEPDEVEEWAPTKTENTADLTQQAAGQKQLASQDAIEKIEARAIEDENGAAKEEATESSMTPDERAYFQKYQKLYAPSKMPAIDLDATQMDSHETTTNADIARGSLPDRIEIAAPTPEAISETHTPESEPQNRETQSDETAQVTETDETKKELPSLKDLLKELEEERLSGDEGESQDMDEKDIDDLIYRITHDY